MSKRGGGLFALPIMFIFIVLLLWIWAVILPDAVTPVIASSISDTASAEHSEGIEFFLRMVPWLVPIIFVLGLVWMGFSS